MTDTLTPPNDARLVVESGNRMPRWWEAAATRIRELQRAPDGWDSYGGRALQDAAITALASIAPDVCTTTEPAIALTPDGGLTVEWAGTGGDFYVTATGQGKVHLYVLTGEVEWEGEVIP